MEDLLGAPRLLLGELEEGLLVEGAGEVVDVLEVIEGILLGLAEEMGLHQGENDVAEIFGGVDSPVLEHLAGQGAELVQAVDPDPGQQLLAGDVARLRKLRDGEVQAGQDEQVGLRLVPGIFPAYPVDFFQKLILWIQHAFRGVINKGSDPFWLPAYASQSP